jgi:hypothetical protein
MDHHGAALRAMNDAVLMKRPERRVHGVDERPVASCASVGTTWFTT